MLIEWIIDYINRARARMLQQFKREEAPNLDKLLQVMVAEIQEAENELHELLTFRSVATASGEQLDVLGDIVGIDREGRTDSDFRDVIFLQIAINNGGGQESVLSALLDNLTDATVIDIWETFPAGLDIFINSDDLSLNTIQSLRRAIAATVSLQFAYTDGGVPFAFEGDSYGEGFGSTADAAEGGEWAAVYTEV